MWHDEWRVNKEFLEKYICTMTRIKAAKEHISYYGYGSIYFIKARESNLICKVGCIANVKLWKDNCYIHSQVICQGRGEEQYRGREWKGTSYYV